MQHIVVLSKELLLKRLVERILVFLDGRVLPELGKLLNGLILNLDIASVLQLVDNDS